MKHILTYGKSSETDHIVKVSLSTVHQQLPESGPGGGQCQNRLQRQCMKSVYENHSDTYYFNA